ncbi:MAG: zinc-ribbon domain-containing protein [Methanobrevibacter millerae]|uniref:Zinc-ribbon domain-containing protein n=1 Tax=Methanobrevibacter millerae TaxID=230361 RepID=A0A8T3VHU8_9EURY|nr:zinc-ribbon domain-containing protein [Methanobrevibacter millerae]MBE6505706.1 zinc-ribbon domain-containing protein [Methanobrevibacter millerae]
MVACKNCGCELPEEAQFCRECGSKVIEEEPVKEIKFCQNCGSKIPKNTKFCFKCGASAVNPQTNNTYPLVNQKSPGLAALLSFLIVGLGQVYVGLTKKGILLFLGAIISGILMLVLIGWITWLLIWGYGIFDAYNSAEKINQGIDVADTIDFDNLF